MKAESSAPLFSHFHVNSFYLALQYPKFTTIPMLLSWNYPAKRSLFLQSFLNFLFELQGLVAFSEHGLMIRWWSLGSGWWEKLSRNYVPVQCTKLIFIPPWEGFSPKTARTSVMASIMGSEGLTSPKVIFILVGIKDLCAYNHFTWLD